MADGIQQRGNEAGRSRGLLLKLSIAGLLVVLCVPCTGVVAAVALPAFVNYIRRSKTLEARTNLKALAAAAAAYYEAEQSGPEGQPLTHCTVPAATSSREPGPDPRAGTLNDPSFAALGFQPTEPVYYQYRIVTGPSRCGIAPNSPLYTFQAIGDLDGDLKTSLFELSTGSDANNHFKQAPGIYIRAKLE